MEIQRLPKQRFEALAVMPVIRMLIDGELEWYTTPDERISGMLTFDKNDHEGEG